MPELRIITDPTEILTRAGQFLQSVPDLLRNPSANPQQAAILLAIFVVVVLIVLLSVILLVMRPSEEEEEILVAGEDAAYVPEARERRSMSWLTLTSIVILTVAAVWTVAGITTSAPDVCASCHVRTEHVASRAQDPHRSVSCVSCHESGGPVARATVNLATRVEHVVLARLNPSRAKGYGSPIASDGCAHCHAKQIAETSYNSKRKLKVSHKEPIEAGAECIDCHAVSSGVVSAFTVGMGPCLRCHNGKAAKADCSVCHQGEPSAAIRPSALRPQMAGVQVPNPQCGGCHTDMSKCDACHGIRMPHSTDFLLYGHARPAVIEIWTNGSAGATMCKKCHYVGHNNCQQPGCHIGPMPAHASPSWRDDHKSSTWSGSQTACSCHDWRPWDHLGMNFCEVCHEVKPRGARP